VLEAELTTVRSGLSSLASAHSGRLPRNDELTQHQSELLDAALGGALEALAQVPEALEVKAPAQVPQIGAFDQGLVFVAFNQSPERQFQTIQERLLGEPMIDYITPIGGGYYLVPPGARADPDCVGSGLFRASA
jgi:deferrochelatase/peroxidase EfeB